MVLKNWEKEDETCEKCRQVTKRQRGITKQNIKRMLIPRFDMNEVIITGLLFMIIILALLYSAETSQCRDFLKPLQDTTLDGCKLHCDAVCDAWHSPERVVYQKEGTPLYFLNETGIFP